MALSEITAKLDATVPKLTALAPRKLLPTIVTSVPPMALPELGASALMLGALAAV